MIAIISDLHSNIEALTTALEDIRRHGIPRIFCLGDVIGYGANPRECLALVMQHCEVCLMGNHEDAVLNYAEDFNANAKAAINWTQDQLNSAEGTSEENFALWNFIGDLPDKLESHGAMFVHGSPRDPIREYILPRDVRHPGKMNKVFGAQTQPVCFVGHSHVPGIYVANGLKFLSPSELDGAEREESVFELPANGKVLINVGSVGQPRDGDTRLSYAIYEPPRESGGGRVTFRRLEYDFRRASDRIRERDGLPDYLADRLLVGR